MENDDNRASNAFYLAIMTVLLVVFVVVIVSMIRTMIPKSPQDEARFRVANAYVVNQLPADFRQTLYLVSPDTDRQDLDYIGERLDAIRHQAHAEPDRALRNEKLGRVDTYEDDLRRAYRDLEREKAIAAEMNHLRPTLE